MRNIGRLMSVMLVLILILATCQAEENTREYERKVQYKKSDADIFMKTLTEEMRMELVRSVVSEQDEIKMAKMLWGEDRANPTYMRAAVIWCLFNRMEANKDSIDANINEIIFPGYRDTNLVMDWAVNLVRDVTIRYVLELNGFTDVGRVLPREFLYYEQLPEHEEHTFKTTIRLMDPKCIVWDWSLPSPYKN